MFGPGDRDSKHRCSSSHDPQAMTTEALRSRFRLLLQQIITYQSASAFERRNERAKHRRRWISRLYEAYFPVYVKAGSAVDVDLSTIPEAEKGLQVIREWIRDLLFNERFEMMPPWQFLTFVAELATLTWRLEKHSAVYLLKRAPCITVDRPVDFLRIGDRYIVWDLLNFLQLSRTTSLSAGVIFIKNVLDRQLPIDVNVVCHIVEVLCAAFIIGHRLRVRGSLHDITLSRRLLSRLYANEKLKEQDSHMLRHLVNLMSQLLREIYVGASGFLLYDRSSRIDYQIRNILVMRVCKSVTLLGYNINDPRLHSLILQQFTSFKKLDTRPDVRYSGIFQRYVNATTPEDLIRAVRNTGSYEKNTAEELILLREASRLRGPPLEVFGTRTVLYRNTSDIPALLRGDIPQRFAPPQGAPIPQISSSEHRDSDPSRLGETIARDFGEDVPGVEMPVAADIEDAGIAEPEIAVGDADTNQEQHTVVAPTAPEIQAATFLARLYRTKLARRQYAAEKGVVAETNRLYQTFQETASLETMPTRYRVLYLGPLPLVILCLRNMVTHIANAKTQIRTRMTLAPHSDYERIGAQMVQINAIDRQVQLLKKLLDPKSEFHRLVSEEELRVHVQQVASIACEHPRAIEGMEMELKMAVKAIVQEPAPRKVKPTSPKAKKPQLVVDPEDNYDIESEA